MTGSASATETPDYTVVKSDKAFEIRVYPSMILAEVTVAGDRRQVNSLGFRKLASFIFGDNVSRDTVAMTSPVVSKPEKIDMTSPVVRTMDPEGRWTVNFMMPSEYSMTTLPVPTDPDIRIFKTVPYRTVSIQYNGNNSTENIAKHEAKLRVYVSEHALDAVGAPEYAGYDAPWVPGPLKRNEIHFRLKN